MRTGGETSAKRDGDFVDVADDVADDADDDAVVDDVVVVRDGGVDVDAVVVASRPP